MKKSILISALLTLVGFASSSMAQTVPAISLHTSTSIWMNSFSQIDITTYYSCDALEDTTRALLHKLGAQNVTVTCMGDGDPFHPSLSPTISVSFDSLVPSPEAAPHIPAQLANWTAVELKDFSDCETVRQLVNGLGSHLQLQSYQRDDTACMTPDSPYDYKFNILVLQK